MSLTNFPLISYYDATDRLLDAVVGGDDSPRNRRMAADAVLRAYRELSVRREWRYYWKGVTFETVAAQTSGSIAYDYTGGVNERMVTLTSNTWPSNANQYALIIEGVRYGIDRRISSTVLTLREQDCPTTDIAAGTGYTLCRDTYDLPAGLRRLDFVYDVDAPGRLFPASSPDAILRERRLVRGTTLPRLYAVYRDELYSSALAIHFAPSCSSVRRYQVYGQYMPDDLRVLEYAVGTVTTTAASADVVGVGTSWTQAHVGCVLRISASADTQVPTSLIGERVKNRFAPYVEQGVVRTVTDGTNLTLEQPASQTLAASGYRLSSKIDLEPNAMTNAFLRLAEAMYSPQDRLGQRERLTMYERELAIAMWADQRQIESPGPSFIPTNLADIAASVDATGV